MAWSKDHSKQAKLAAEIALHAGSEAQAQAERASLGADYIDEKKSLIEEFTGEQTNLQAQLDALVVDGDSSPEAAQARVGTDATAYATLKARLDSEQNKVTAQLAETAKQSEVTSLAKTKADKTEVNSLASAKANVTYVDTKVAAIDRGYGGTYATLTALQTAFPTGNANRYVVSADGKWYYWNGVAWISGGVFQATGIAVNGIKAANIPKGSIEYFRHYQAGKYPLTLKKTPKNMFDKLVVTPDFYCSAANGELYANATLAVSDFIPVYPGQVIAKNNKVQLAYFNENKVFVSGISSFATMDGFTVPLGCYYLRTSVLKTELNTFQIEEGAVCTSYENHVSSLLYDMDKYFTSDSLKTMLSGNVFEAGITSRNLFNKNDVTAGAYAAAAGGALISNANYSVSNYIPVTVGETYHKNNKVQLAFYNANKVFVSGIDLVGTETFVIPLNCVFVRVSCLTSQIDTFQLEKGTTATPPMPFGEKLVTKSQLAPDVINILPAKSIKTIMSKIVLSSTTKKIKLIGDSITHGVGGSGFSQDGAVIMNQYGMTWNVNTRGHCWANLLKAYLESKFNCIVNNYGCTGISSHGVVGGLSQLIDADDDIVICMIGTNDRDGNTPQLNFYNNLITIYDYVNDLGKDIIFMSNIPASVTNEAPKAYHMEDVDNIIMKASTECNVEYISVFKLFNEYCQTRGITIDSLLLDGLHPNDTGYDVMFNIICYNLGIGRKRVGATW